jgi:ribose transport system permease protein
MSPLGILRRQDWFGLLLVVVVAILAIGAIKPAFLSSYNIQVLLATAATGTMVALSQAVIIAIGQMNLSIGAVGGLAAIAFAGSMEVWGLPWPLAAGLGLTIGLGAGLLNGWLVARSGISAFIITLATLYIFNGITLGITEAQPFYGVAEPVKWFGDATLVGPLPLLALPTLAVAVAMGVLLARLRIGRHILAAGGNPHAAELGGVDVGGAIIWAHALSGLIAAIAGMMVVARLQIGQPTIGGDWLITSFAAPVIGGALLQGGHVSVTGTVLGVVVIAIITQGLVLFGVDPFAVQIALGLLILWAVGIDRFRSWRQARSLEARA